MQRQKANPDATPTTNTLEELMLFSCSQLTEQSFMYILDHVHGLKKLYFQMEMDRKSVLSQFQLQFRNVHINTQCIIG